MGTPQLPRTEAADQANLVRLQPLRVVISGRDRRYIRVTSFLLMRKGYEVAVAAPEDAALVAQRKRADVVLLEAGESRAASGGPIAALLALSGTPSVLIVTDDLRDARWNGLTTIKKWIPLDALAAEIEAASRARPRLIAEAGSGR